MLIGADERQLIKRVLCCPRRSCSPLSAAIRRVSTKYAVALAQQFHHFYNACRIKDAEPAVRDARLTLCLAAKQTIENVLEAHRRRRTGIHVIRILSIEPRYSREETHMKKLAKRIAALAMTAAMMTASAGAITQDGQSRNVV